MCPRQLISTMETSIKRKRWASSWPETTNLISGCSWTICQSHIWDGGPPHHNHPWNRGRGMASGVPSTLSQDRRLHDAQVWGMLHSQASLSSAASLRLVPSPVLLFRHYRTDMISTNFFKSIFYNRRHRDMCWTLVSFNCLFLILLTDGNCCVG